MPDFSSASTSTSISASPPPDMRSRVANHDWAATPLGPLSAWPAGLKAIVTLMLDSPEPMVVWWGEDLRQIYNDAYAPRVEGEGRQAGLGQPAAASWTHGWGAVGPQVQRVLAGQAAGGYRDFLIEIEREGRLAHTYWTYSFTPVRDDAGAIRGVLLLSAETTAPVLGARRHETLDRLRGRIADAGSADALAAAMADAVRFNPGDLAGVAIEPAWPPAASFPDAGQGGERIHAATATRMRIAAAEVGVDADLALVFDLSPKLPFDKDYRVFLEQFTLLVATARHRIDSEALRRIVEAERDRLLLDAPVGAAVMVGEDLVYRLVNPIYAMVSGRPAADMVGQAFVDVFPELRGSPVHENFLAVYRAGEPYVEERPMLVQIHRHGGALDDRYFTYNLSPLRALDGRVYGLMVIAVDITVQVEARAEVEALNIELQAAARAKDEFLALLGHELRNPLAPIVTALELMRMRDRTTDREQVIIRRQVSHLTRLVDDLLDVSRITRGKVELRQEEVEVREVLLRAVEMVTPLIEQKQQRLQVEIAPARWYGDPARLAQIVSNLLTNAARYSQADALIRLRAGAGDGALAIEVADNGMGIPPELLPRIFEPFVQGERKLHSAVGGLGIGLALVRNLAEMHGGGVSARSAGSGQGSTFTVRLPLVAAPPPAGRQAAAPAARLSGHASSDILVVDDNIDAADTLADTLRSHGHRVAVAYTPETALQAFAHSGFDLAILDIGLPGMSGYELADLMRETGRNAGLRYIALTGFGQQFDKERSAAAGFAAHLVKPVDLAQLVAVV